MASKKTTSTSSPKKTSSKKSSKVDPKKAKKTSSKKKGNKKPHRLEMNTPDLKQSYLDNLLFREARSIDFATPHDQYEAEAYTVRDRLMERWIETQKTYQKKKAKRAYYFSAEFLIGRLLNNNLVNLGIKKEMHQALTDLQLDPALLEQQETDAGLGNGGLGRLAACFMDSMATLGVPGTGYGIRYEFGIFEQAIENGHQIEKPDRWLRYGNVWEVIRPEYTVTVHFGGKSQAYLDADGHYRVRWVDTDTVLGIPHDTPVSGYHNNTVNNLRLWTSSSNNDFDFNQFNQGDYELAVREKTESENISKVLYPNDNSMQGKELRLKQQYFFVACSLADIIRRHKREHKSLNNLHEYAVIQLNDTHPAVAIPELLRILVDQEKYGWEDAWNIVTQTFAYTNHTLLPEALEKWPVSIFQRLLPRHLEIIREINTRFINDIAEDFEDNPQMLRELSIFDENYTQIRMAHLAVIGSFSVNGVAELHTELLKSHVLKNFARLWPEKFNNKTNGVTPRRWIVESNPELTELLHETIGKEWPTDLDQLEKLEPHIEKKAFRNKFLKVKQQNKARLAQYILKTTGIKVDENSIFDIHIKRFHEYKRQHLNALHIIHLYHQLKQNPKMDITPRTFIFAGKAAPGYFLAKRIIKLINAIAEVVNDDPDVAGRIKVVFLPNYSVSLAEILIPAADVSEQTSTAGFEASGTGNMKFALNGAITIGTLDGANVEIRQCVGHDNFFLFGLTADKVEKLKNSNYRPFDYYDEDPHLRTVIDLVARNHFSPDEPGVFHPIIEELLGQDRFMLMADFADYVQCQQRLSRAYQNRDDWAKMALRNIARCGKFSSDRTISQYAKEIWKTEPIQVDLPS